MNPTEFMEAFRITQRKQEVPSRSAYYFWRPLYHLTVSFTAFRVQIHTYYCIFLFPPFLIHRTKKFALPGLLRSKPNLINWNYHFRGPAGELYGQGCSIYQLYCRSEQLPKCLHISCTSEFQLREAPTNPEHFLHITVLEL